MTDKETRRLIQEKDTRERTKRLNAVLSKVMVGMKPPDDLTVTEWAEKNRRLSTEASAEPGPWRTDRTPYLREPMDSFTDPKVRRIVMVAASQVGKSEFINNTIGYIIDEDPGSILFVHPTTIDTDGRIKNSAACVGSCTMSLYNHLILICGGTNDGQTKVGDKPIGNPRPCENKTC